MSEALSRVRSALSAASLDGIIVTAPENRFYLSGFTGSAATLVISSEKALLLTDFRYVEQAQQQSPVFSVTRTSGDALVTLKEVLGQFSGAKFAYEADHVTVSWYRRLEALGASVELVPEDKFIEKVRSVKTDAELGKMASAARLADEGFLYILNQLRPGVTEKEIALDLEFYMRKRGSEGLPFDIIVASGVRSSMPHGRASDKVIEMGDFVTMDFGARVNGYCSDLTRTVVIGRASERQREIYDLVYRAHMEALSSIGPGKSCVEVDGVARSIISEAGHADHFGHGLGHGVGVVVHEMPRLSPLAQDAALVPGNVVSNEPGIYIPGWGGVRIEDLIAVTKAGHRNLNSSTKQLIEIV